MEDNILLYEVQSNDTLSSIATSIGMSPDELRDFHNSHCHQQGLMFFNGLAGIRKIVIPKKYKSDAQIRKEITDSVPPRNTNADFYATSYDVLESYESADENKIEINYSIEVDLQKEEENQIENYVASVRTYDFKKNGLKPDDKMSGLSIACLKSISPLQFIIPPKGQIVGIHDFENLRSTFEQKRKDLEDFFIGEVASRYFDKFAESLTDEIYYKEQIRSTLIYQVLFPKMDWFHQQRSWTEEFYLVKNSFAVTCFCTVSFIHLSEDRIETIIHGKITDQVSLQELLRGRKVEEEAEEPMAGSIELKYTTHKATKQLLAAEALIVLLHEGEVYRKQTIKLSKI